MFVYTISLRSGSKKAPLPKETARVEISPSIRFENFVKFKSEQEFKDYLAKVEVEEKIYKEKAEVLEGAPSEVSTEARGDLTLPPSTAEKTGEGTLEYQTVERVSQTNVQVFGIDEPDILKNDGSHLYYSTPLFRIQPKDNRLFEQPGAVRPETIGGLKIAKAYPPEDLKLDATIAESGDLLLDNNNLIIFEDRTIYGYDVSDPNTPEKKWQIDLERKSQKVQARLYQGRVYLVTKVTIDKKDPCPIVPFSTGGKPFQLKCTDVYHPLIDIVADALYTVSVFNPQDGQVINQVSFVGSSSSSIIYMSKEAVYVAYHYNKDFLSVFADFAQKNPDLFSPQFVDWVEELKRADHQFLAEKISQIEQVIEDYQRSLKPEVRAEFEKEFEEKIKNYLDKDVRGFERTSIVKIDAGSFQVVSIGDLPGRLLNQFSLDQYENYLRVATTTEEDIWFLGFQKRRQSTNDVYVMAEDLTVVGSIKDLGLTEKIYSVRFVQERAYLVTFRQTDPFFVLDLTDPQNPKLKGELKIPGFSSYLHPLSEEIVLGVGKEGQNIKVSLFNVKSAENPVELDKYLLKESWSDISNTHHAFLADSRHKIFFIPAGGKGYIFSYQNDRLSMIKTVDNIQAKRAAYINDYLYLVGDSKVVVLDETSWQRAEELNW